MRKRLLLTLLIPILLFTGCNNKPDYKKYSDNILCEINDKECLYYDCETRIVYLIIQRAKGRQGFGYMSPYYAPNGKPYRYIDGELKEIEE